MAVTRGLAWKLLSATALVEYICSSTLQLTHFVAVSGELALQREQVCTADLLKFFIILLCADAPAKVLV